MIKKKILVTGAGGYIGKSVVKQLLDMNLEVVAVDISANNIDKRAKVIVCDIFDSSEDIYEKLGRPDICLHLAWKDGFKHNSDAHMNFLPLHYEFLRNLIEGGIEKVAVLGSMHEVGYHEGVVDENTPTKPRSLYGISKNALRESMAVLKESSDVKIQWLRAYYIYGNDLENNSIFTKLIISEKEGKKEFPFTSGLNKYDFIDIKDLALEISMAILQDEVLGIINCSIGKPVSLKEKVEEFIRVNNMNVRLNYGAFPERQYDSPIIYGDNTKIKTIIAKAIKDDLFDINSDLENLYNKYEEK